jgi:exonuclease SbcC
MEEATPRAESVPRLEKELSQVQARLEELTQEENALAEGQSRLQEMSAKVGQMRADRERLNAEGQELRTRLELLEKTPEGARCPLCDSELGEAGFQHLQESHQTQIEEKRALYREVQRQLQALEGEQKALQRDLTQREASLRAEQRKAQARQGGLERQIEDANRAAKELGEGRQRLQGLEKAVADGEFASDDRARLATLEREIASLGYEPQHIEETRRLVEEARLFEGRHHRLEEARERLPQERRSLETVERAAQRIEQELTSLVEKAAQLSETESELSRQEEVFQRVEERVRGLDEEERDLSNKEAVLNNQLRRITQYEQEMHSLRRRSRTLGDEVDAYRELAQAFGRRGVQAVLIESVLPELEREADGLLGSMTENRMHLKLESLRELRSRRGDSVETLDIKISDELGTRNYEMYSGGEAFRVNLALRIALSRVLAQRQGAPLPTLFIDEGFGTQDAVGRERIIEVIGAIEHLFQKIIVITHLDEVKEAFPVRIEVQKTERGSTFAVT